MTDVPGPHPANSLPAESAWEKKRTEIETLLASPPAKPSTKAQSLTRQRTPSAAKRIFTFEVITPRRETPSAPTFRKFFPPTLNSSNPSRLDLAHWLFAPENPSTAPRFCEPNLAASLWDWDCRHLRRPWNLWRSADTSGIARLARHRIPRQGLEPEEVD